MQAVGKLFFCFGGGLLFHTLALISLFMTEDPLHDLQS
jgi:hypothetical protein